jgi:hypothetical protein
VSNTNQLVVKSAVSIAQFCAEHSISRATFYNLRRIHLAPETMLVGRRRLVSTEAARDWRERMEGRGAVPAAGEAQ